MKFTRTDTYTDGVDYWCIIHGGSDGGMCPPYGDRSLRDTIKQSYFPAGKLHPI